MMRNIHKELADLRARTVSLLVRNHGTPPDVVFTCDECPHKVNCPSVYDAYNTDGDCLEDR